MGRRLARGRAVEVFEEKLESGLRSLMELPTPCPSLAWLEKALGVLGEAHDTMESLVPDKSEVLGSQDMDWLRRCVANLDGLLHACSTLRRSMDDIRYYDMYVQLALQALGRGQRPRARNLLGVCIDDGHVGLAEEREVSRMGLQKARLESCRRLLLAMVAGEKSQEDSCFETPPPFPFRTAGESGEVFFSAVHGIRLTSIFLLLALSVCLTVKPSPLPASPPPSPKKASAVGPSWWVELCKLRDRVREEMTGMSARGAFAMLHELDRVDERARQLHGLLLLTQGDGVKELECASELSRCLEQVEGGLLLVEGHINQIVKVLSSCRAVALRLLGDKVRQNSRGSRLGQISVGAKQISVQVP